jgi:hypothetical protein
MCSQGFEDFSLLSKASERSSGGWLRALSPDRDESLDSLGDGLIATMVFNCCAALVGYRLTGATLLVMD